MDTLKFVAAGFWSLVGFCFLLTLLAGPRRLLERWECRLKPGAGPCGQISTLRRAVFVLMCAWNAAIGFASAFYTELGTLTGIGAPAVFNILVLFPSLFIVLGILEQIRNRKHHL